jgi:hypothetical protein
LYGDTQAAEAAEDEDSGASDVDIENEIKKEVEGIRKPKVEPLFKNVKLPGQCCKLQRHDHPIKQDAEFGQWYSLRPAHPLSPFRSSTKSVKIPQMVSSTSDAVS